MPDAIHRDFIREQAVWYLKRWTGTQIPYRWGGDDPMTGFDCGGLILEVLKGAGLFAENRDLSADGLFKEFVNDIKTNEVYLPYKGCLVFWFNNMGKSVHVAMMIDKEFLVHAAGGGSDTVTPEVAAKRNAYIMMRRLDMVIEQRKRAYGQEARFVDPFMGIE